MKVIRAVFSIVAVVSLVLLLFVFVEGRSESRQCFYSGECVYDENKIGFRYYQCLGSYAAYSHVIQDTRCMYPDKYPKGVRPMFSKEPYLYS